MYAAFVFAMFFIHFPLFAQTNQMQLDNLKEIKRIAFGSCNNQDDRQPLWKVMTENRPDIFVWGGDNVYSDWGKSDSLAEAYKKQNENLDYMALKARTPIIGTWDDHDFAYDNAGGEVTFKKDSQRMFLDFFEVPQYSYRRFQEGIYTSHNFGKDGRRIKFIMLDQRYFKGIDPKAPMLGETQWQWLENEFKFSNADLHFVHNGLPIFGPAVPYTEEWAHFPSERQRLLKLIKKYQPKGLVFITGDKHFSSIYKYWGQLEFMSSGLTHTADRGTWWYLGRKFPNSYFGPSYGEIEIEWEGEIPLLTLFMRNVFGNKIHKRQVRWKNNEWVFELRP